MSLSGSMLTVSVDGVSDSVNIASASNPLRGTLKINSNVNNQYYKIVYLFTGTSKSRFTGHYYYFNYDNPSKTISPSRLSSENVILDFSDANTVVDISNCTIQSLSFDAYSYSGTCRYRPDRADMFGNVMSFTGSGSGTIQMHGSLYTFFNFEEICGALQNTNNMPCEISLEIPIVNGNIFYEDAKLEIMDNVLYFSASVYERDNMYAYTQNGISIVFDSITVI